VAQIRSLHDCIEGWFAPDTFPINGNVSGANQPLRATVQTFNLNHMMLIQGDVWGEWEGGFEKM
jgi:hypothetical protein